jgi:F-type H+-transporting ATPase subunit delta
MLAQQIAKKYGRALFELAKERNLIDQGWEQFNALSDYLKSDSTFHDFVTAPQIGDGEKAALVKKVFEPRLERIFYEYIQMLVAKHRIHFLPEIIDEFDRLVRADRGIAKAICITTAPITDVQRRQLIEQLSQKTGLKVELEEKIDMAIVGGMIVTIQDQILDGSIKYALSLLRNRLLKVKVH